jgi:ribonuclease VapC
MTGVVLDASALLAFLLREPGANRVKTMLGGAMMTTVNLAEVVSHYAKSGVARHEIERLLNPLPIQFVRVDAELSYEAGMLRSVTVQQGLSLGDRYCLALARLKGALALTAERRWPEIAGKVGVAVEVIR